MDDNRKRFEARLRRLEERSKSSPRAVAARKQGIAQEQQAEMERSVRPIRVTVRLIALYALFLLGKAVVVHTSGPEAYDARVAEMQDTGSWQSVVAVVLQRGPAMRMAEPVVAEVLDGSSGDTRLAIGDAVVTPTRGEAGN